MSDKQCDALAAVVRAHGSDQREAIRREALEEAAQIVERHYRAEGVRDGKRVPVLMETFVHDDCPMAAAIRALAPTCKISLQVDSRPTASPAPQPSPAELAQLVARYYRREIGRLMHQAEHWAKNDKPLAVHDRVNHADSLFQIVVLMERDPSQGWTPPFDEMRDSLSRPWENHDGAYPPSAEISAYRDPRHAVAQLRAAPREGVILDEWTAPNLAMFIRRLINRLRKFEPDHKSTVAALDYLRRNNLAGNLLRDEAHEREAGQ